MRRLAEDHKEIASGKKVDDEGYMANLELDTIDSSVKRLKKVIKNSKQQLPAWVQSKITKAADYIDTAAEYLSSDEKIDEGMSFDINPEGHKKARPPVGAEKLRNMSPSQRKQLPNQEVVQKKVGVTLPKLKKSSLAERILAEMGCDCDMKSHKSVNQIAKLHNTTVERIEKELKRGIKVEMEHTTDKKEAESIALQHLEEKPDYYRLLSKVEKKSEIKEGTASGDSSLHDWFKKSSGTDPKTGRKVKGWVQLGGPYAGAPCARQPGQKSTPKCGSSKMAKNLSDEKEEKSFRRKNKKDPNQPAKSGASKPTYVKTEEYLVQEAKKEKGKKDACYHKVRSRYDVWPSAYSSGALVKCRKVGASNWGTKSEEFVQEGVRIQSQSGQLMNIMLNWRGKIIVTQIFFPQVKIPNRREVIDAVEKVYPDAKVLSFRVSNIDPKLPLVQVNEEEAWQKVNRKDNVDGLSQKAVDAYRKEHPGSKLQTAVTEKKPKGKRANRRKAFCRRMSGMKSKLTSAKTSRDPNSRINKALRRWNCN